MPLFNISIPATSMILVQAVMGVATFDIPYLDVPSIFGEDVFSDEIIFVDQNNTNPVFLQNLDDVGYGSHWMAPAMGSIYIFMMITLAALLLIVLLYPFLKIHTRLVKI